MDISQYINKEQTFAATRWAFATGGGYALGHGWINAETFTFIAGLGVSAAPLIWGYITNTKAAIVEKAAIVALPDIKPIEVKPTADASLIKIATDPNVPNVIVQQ